jgi:hypothetical protein
MDGAEEDLTPLISDMAYNFFPWNDPTTSLTAALPWIQAVVLSFLSFIPVVGELLWTVEGSVETAILSALMGSAQSFTQGGFSEISTLGVNPL